MSGLDGFSGIALTLWTQMTRVDKIVQRNIIQNFNLMILAMIFAYYLVSGKVQ